MLIVKLCFSINFGHLYKMNKTIELSNKSLAIEENP